MINLFEELRRALVWILFLCIFGFALAYSVSYGAWCGAGFC